MISPSHGLYILQALRCRDRFLDVMVTISSQKNLFGLYDTYKAKVLWILTNIRLLFLVLFECSLNQKDLDLKILEISFGRH